VSAPAATSGSDRRDDIVRRGVFGVLLVAAASLVLAHRYLPLVDWPEHLAQDAIVAHSGDASFGTDAYYRTTGWFLPYQGFRWLHIALAAPFGIGLGGRIALLAYLLGAPLAIAALLRRFGRDPWLAIAAFTVLVEGNLLWGFAPYALAVALSLGALALAIDYGRRGGWLRLAALSIVGAGIFFTHAQQTAVYVVSLTVLGLVAWRRRAISTSRLAGFAFATFVPSVLLGAYLISAGWLSGRALADPFAIAPRTLWRAPHNTLRFLPLSAGLTTAGRAPWRIYLATMIAVLLAAIVQQWWRRTERTRVFASRDQRPWTFAAGALALTWLALAFALPAEFRGQTLSPRLASAAFLGLLWLPRLEPPRGSRERRLSLALHLLISAGALATMLMFHLHFARFDRSMRPLDAIVAQTPLRARVATLVYGTHAVDSKLPLYLHVGGYLVAWRGGLAASGFTRTGVTYRDSVPREALLVNESWMPSVLGSQIDLDRFGPYYDYVLVRRGRLYAGTPFAMDATTRFSVARVAVAGDFELWRIRAL
jgi:hypothetical protein